MQRDCGVCKVSENKTLLLLGGSMQQVVAIEAAKKCGYRTVLCDYLPDNPGQHSADKFYLVSTTDREAVLEVAKSENINGVIAYSSDPAAPTAAYVAEQLGLPTNSLASVTTLSFKNLFREHLRKAGLPCPKAVSFKVDAKLQTVLDAVKELSLPFVIKPTDASGSKGVTVLTSENEISAALDWARANSRNGVLIAEEYIERSFPHVIGGDVFVVNGRIVFWGLMRCLRDERCGLVPVGKAIPCGLNSEQTKAVKETFQKLVDSLDIRFGELNIEALVGKDGLVYILELGSRAGGNMIPVQLSDASGIDLVRANVMCAMGEDPGEIAWEPTSEYSVTHVLHSLQDGVYQGFELSDAAQQACYRKVIYQQPGDRVFRFDGANKALGILFFKFDDAGMFNAYLDDVDAIVKALIETNASNVNGRED